MDWANGKCQLTNLATCPISHRFVELNNLFNFISFPHIFGELNTKIDPLSKVALSLQEGALVSQEYRGENLLYNSLIVIF
jgi:hypothetical protein